MLCLLCLMPELPVLPMRQGEFIFFHHSLIPEATSQGTASEWTRLKQFRFLLTNGYRTFPPEQVAALHEHGGRLFFYFWFNGFYAHEAKQPLPDGDWQREILEKHREWLINPDSPEQGGGAIQPAYFFDFTQPALRQFLSHVIAAHRRRTGYDGVFFDYAGSYALPTSTLERYGQRHPDVAYDAAGALFLQTLKTVDPGILVFTNQAYRAAEHLLPFTDIDCGESLATSFAWGKEVAVSSAEDGLIKTNETYYRPWGGAHGIKAYYTDILQKVRRLNPGVRFFTVNYVKAFWEPTEEKATHEDRVSPVHRKRPDRAAIFYGYVAVKLFGLDSYSSDWYDVGYYDDEVFLIDLGRPKGSQPEERAGVVVRYYENGFVALTTTEKGGVFDASSDHVPSEMKGLWDVYERCFAPDFPKQRRVTIPPTVSRVSGSTYPSGRVYVYVR